MVFQIQKLICYMINRQNDYAAEDIRTQKIFRKGMRHTTNDTLVEFHNHLWVACLFDNFE